jgi:acetylornithine deacetylase/succinyl-diaminopimelate desuccinylase-like protein
MRRIVLVAALFLNVQVIAQVINADVSSADYTDPWQVYAHELLRDSVAFKSVRGEKQVVPLVEFLAQKFRDAGFPDEDVHVLPLDSDGEPVASLVVRYRGSSTSKRPILFVAHTDVVVTAEDWERDPFVLTEDAGNYWGRGVLDDKFATTILTTNFARLKSEGFVPERDLIIAFTGDEETRMLSTKSLTQDHFELVDAEFAFNIDAGTGRLSEDFKPIATFLQFAEKMYVSFRVTARNPGGHSSKPAPDNAIADLARAITAIHNFDFPVRSSNETRTYFAEMGKLTEGELGEAMRRFAADPYDQVAADFLKSQPEQVGVTRTTCVPTLLSGGHAENALPESATLTVNCRVYPGVSVAEVKQVLQEVVDDPAIEISAVEEFLPAPPSVIRNDIYPLIDAAMPEQFAGVPIVPFMAPYATDGIYFRRAGIPTYGLYGMFLRDGEDRSHSSNESLPIDRFYGALDFWYQLTQSSSAL